MVNHICEPISSNQFASCSSARVGQGGGGAPLTIDQLEHGSDDERDIERTARHTVKAESLTALVFAFDLYDAGRRRRPLIDVDLRRLFSISFNSAQKPNTPIIALPEDAPRV